jgi:hypothetical protein
MKTHWQLSRTFIARGDGQRRWDYAYQLLLRWAMETPTGLASEPSTNQEKSHEDRPLCSCLDQSAAANPDH